MDASVLAVGVIDCVSGIREFGEIADGIVRISVGVAPGFLGGCQSIQVIIAKRLGFSEEIIAPARAQCRYASIHS